MSTSTLNPPGPPTSPPPTTTTSSASSASAPAPAPVSVSASVPVPVQTTVQTPVQTSTNHHLHPSLNSDSQRILPPPHHDSRLYTQSNHHQHQQQHQQDPKPDHHHHQQQQQQHPNQHQHHDQSFNPDHHHHQQHHPNHHIDQKPQLTESGNSSIYESNYLHVPPPHSNMNSQSHQNCFASNDHNNNNNNNDRLNHHPHNGNKLGTRNTISPSLSHRSTPTPSPTSSPSSPPFYNTNNGNILDLNSIVSYSQLIQRREEVVAALKYRSGDHYAQQALDLLKAGRERVKRITAAGRAATGKPPVKHIQEQYLAVFSRFSEYCASQNIPTWPIEPVRVAIWVLAMQEKAPPTPATLRQYITRLEFTCTVTAGLFDSEFGPSSPLKASALLRELVNRDLPGQNKLKPTKSPKSNKRSRSQTDGSITPPSSKKWQANHPNSAPGAGGPDQHNQHDYAISEHQQQHQHHHHPHHHQPHYEPYLSPFGTPATPYHPSPLGSSQPHHTHEIWPPHHPRYSTGPANESIPSYHHHHHPHLTHHHRTDPQRSYPTFVSQPGPSSSFAAPSTSTTPTTTATPTTSAPAQSDPRYAHPTVEANPWV